MKQKIREIAENDQFGGEFLKAGGDAASRAEGIQIEGSASPARLENTHRPSPLRSSSELPTKLAAIPIFFNPKFYAVLVLLIGALIGVVLYLLWF